jgi:hypothetical protein
VTSFVAIIIRKKESETFFSSLTSFRLQRKEKSSFSSAVSGTAFANYSYNSALRAKRISAYQQMTFFAGQQSDAGRQKMKYCLFILAIFVGNLLPIVPASANVIDLNYVSVATGVDNGPQDGVFDSISPINLGLVNNNGFTSFRTAFEFDLSELPVGFTINSAQLSMALHVDEGTRAIEVHGYAGDGTVQLGDFALNGVVGTAQVNPGPLQFLTFDVTSFVANLVTNGKTFPGFNVREEPANPSNFTVMDLTLSSGLPVLSIDFSVDSPTWSLTGNMAQPRRDHTATLLSNGKVLIVGTTFTAELFDLVSKSFSFTGNPLVDHGPLATATRLADDRVLIVGGTGAPITAEIYNPTTGVFTLTGSLKHSAIAHTATLLHDGKVLIAGGQTPGRPESQAVAEVYDPATGVFTETGSLNTDRTSHEATLLSNGKVLITGGIQTTTPGQGFALVSAELYDTARGIFSPTGNMNLARAGHTVTLLLQRGKEEPEDWRKDSDHLYHNRRPRNSTKVLITGGAIGSNSAELYDPAKGTFGFTGNMSSPRGSHTATLLRNGQVLLAGGSTAVGPVTTNSAELYDPLTGTFVPTASMNSVRQEHTATLLLNGQVLVTGGTNGTIDLSSAELFIEPQIDVQIDIDPNRFPNRVNLKRNKIEVAILSSDTFDATAVEPSTLLFGKTGTEACPVRLTVKDINGDRAPDMVLWFNTVDTELECGDEHAMLTGAIVGGPSIQGSDSIVTVGCKAPKKHHRFRR